MKAVIVMLIEIWEHEISNTGGSSQKKVTDGNELLEEG